MTTLFAYARVSADDQSLDLQLLAFERAGVPTANTASDFAVSGKVPAMERPGMLKTLSRMSRGDTLVVYSLSRIGRSLHDVVNVLHLLEERGIALRSLTEYIDTSTPTGRAMIGMLATFSQLERDLMLERTNAGIAAAKARGVRFGREETPGRRAQVEACCAAGMSKAEAARHLSLPYNAVKRMWPGRAAWDSAGATGGTC